jgi:GT2 family glycosyltransferase
MVSIIILSYNTKDLLHASLTSLVKQLDLTSYEIIVVDNASSDDSVEMVKKDFTDVKLIENDENAGFAKGCNLGAKHAKGEYTLFLNSDTQLKENHLDEMATFLEMHEKVAVIGGKFHNTDGSIQRSFGKFYTLPSVFLMLTTGDKGELLRNTSNTLQYVDWVSGGFMLVRRSVFDSLGGFDEHFFMYIEDMELCYRVKKLGYQVAYYPKTVIEHVGHGSSNRTFAIVSSWEGNS